jgi:biopolymer transport protein ExbB
MYVLYILSFVALCLVFYYFFSLRREAVVPASLMAQFDEKKKDLAVIGEICAEDESPLSKIVLSGIETLKKPNCTYAMMRDALEDEGARQGSMLWQRIQYLQDIAIISPMVGLLGTVIGMIISFGRLQAENMTPRPTIVAQGISMALITTAAGLIIGISAMLVYAYFRGRVNNLIAELEASAAKVSRELFRYLVAEPSGKEDKTQ